MDNLSTEVTNPALVFCSIVLATGFCDQFNCIYVKQRCATPGERSFVLSSCMFLLQWLDKKRLVVVCGLLNVELELFSYHV